MRRFFASASGAGFPGCKIVVLRSGAVGDCIVSTPALAILRREYPDAEITLVCAPASAGVFLHSPDVDRMVILDSRSGPLLPYLRRLLHLRRERFSLLIDMHGNGRTFIQTLMIGGKRRLGYSLRPLRNRAYTDLVPYRSNVHTVLREADVLLPLGLSLEAENPSAAPLRWQVTEEEREEARRLLLDAGCPSARPYVVLHPTTAPGRPVFRQWPARKFAALADRIVRDLNLGVVLTSQDPDDPAIVEFLDLVSVPVFNLVGKTSLRTLAGVIEGARHYVGYNTGPMHIAAALGVPIAALFDWPMDLVQWHPWTNAPYRLVRAGPRCDLCPKVGDQNLPCSQACSQPWCMQTVAVDAVIDAVQKLQQFVQQPLTHEAVAAQAVDPRPVAPQAGQREYA